MLEWLQDENMEEEEDEIEEVDFPAYFKYCRNRIQIADIVL